MRNGLVKKRSRIVKEIEVQMNHGTEAMRHSQTNLACKEGRWGLDSSKEPSNPTSLVAVAKITVEFEFHRRSPKIQLHQPRQ